MKTQSRDPLGILNYLHNIPDNDAIFNILLESSESFDLCMIRHNRFLSVNQKALLLARAMEPASLLHLCRLVLYRLPYSCRNILGTELPRTLQNYLNYD